MSDREEIRALEKAPTGIAGFDNISGGLPHSRTTLVIGGPGSGKTVFALQTLVYGARERGEPGIFVAFEENSRHIIANAAGFGWDLPALEKEKLFFLDARMSPDVVLSGKFDLAGMLASLAAKAGEMHARRIAFDSIDVLLAMIDDAPTERLELYRIRDWLSQSNLTGLITARVSEVDLGTAHRYGFLQYLADCVVQLHHRLPDQISMRYLRVAKYRGSGFAEGEFAMVIGPAGIEVGSAEAQAPDYPVYAKRISSGIARLDTMLDGGYFRGTSTLITGAPGTAKSSLCAAFAQAACQREERALYVSFDENPSELLRNFSSIGIQLAPYVEAGLLRLQALRTDAGSAEEHMMVLKRLINEYEPRCVIIDPLSALGHAGGTLTALGVARRLLYLTKARGITLLCTSLLETSSPTLEAAEVQVSTIADTWLHLSYVVQGGERNRALTIVKSRGTGHSNQVRELILSDEGITLTDVYAAEGEVLMGTLRAQKETEARREQQEAYNEIEVRRRSLQLAEADARARIEVLQREVEARQRELAQLQTEQDGERAQRMSDQRDWDRRRGKDAESPARRSRPASAPAGSEDQGGDNG